MKRFWLGIGILALFLALGFWSSYGMQSLLTPLTHSLEKAAASALSGDLASGKGQAQSAKKQWDSQWGTTAILADHTPMDEIDSHFARLEVYAQTDNAEAFAASCRHLAQLITATAEAHTFTWRNIL